MSYEENPRSVYAYDEYIWRFGAQYDTADGGGWGDGTSSATHTQIQCGNTTGGGGIRFALDEDDYEISKLRAQYESWASDWEIDE